MIQQNTIAVLGGGGRTGKFIVTELLMQGYRLKLLLRNPENFQLEREGIEVIKGDAIDPAAIRSLVKNCQAVISTIGQRQGEPLVASQATMNILDAMSEFSVQRYILVAGLNVDTPFDKKSEATKVATEWMKSSFPLIHADRQKTYSILTESQVNWTLVRVPFIEFTDVKSEVVISVEDCKGNKVTAASIATFAIDHLTDDLYSRQAPFIANT